MVEAYRGTPTLVYAVDDENIQIPWDEEAMDERPDLHWDKPDPELRDAMRERIGNALCNSSIPDSVKEIVFDVGYNFRGARTE